MRVSRGSLTDEALRLRTFKNDPSRHWVKSLIPAHIANPDGTKGIMGRQCTFNYKVEMLERTARRLARIRRGEKQKMVTQWIGISSDEIYRMKPARQPWIQHRWPLIEMVPHLLKVGVAVPFTGQHSGREIYGEVVAIEGRTTGKTSVRTTPVGFISWPGC